MPAIFKNWNFELTEERDWPDDPAPRLRLRWLLASLGAGRCQCGRRTPVVDVSAEIEEEEIIELIGAVLDYYWLKKQRRMERAGRVDRIGREVERIYTERITFLERWRAELRGRDSLFD